MRWKPVAGNGDFMVKGFQELLVEEPKVNGAGEVYLNPEKLTFVFPRARVAFCLKTAGAVYCVI